MYSASAPKLAELTFSSGTYQLTPLVSSTVPLASVPITSGSDTGTVDIDTAGRMWMASDTTNSIEVRYADAPYTSWSAPITLANTSSTLRDACAVIAFGGKIGVLWSDLGSQRFGFRYHVDGTDPTIFSSNEVPASQSAQNVGGGMADNHINLKAASDGTLYAAVKTAYDAHTVTNPEMALLVRRLMARGTRSTESMRTVRGRSSS